MQDAGVVMPREGVAMDYAGLGSRFVALLIDGIILSVVMFVLALLFGEDFGDFRATSFWLTTVVEFFYFTVLLSQTGTTLGGRVMGINVVDAVEQTLSMGSAAVRSIVAVIEGLLNIIGLIGYLWAFWDKRKQTIHDNVAGSYVVKA